MRGLSDEDLLRRWRSVDDGNRGRFLNLHTVPTGWSYFRGGVAVIGHIHCPADHYLDPRWKVLRVRSFIEREIQKPLAEVWPKTLAQWEDNFRRDTKPEQEIGLWCRIAERFFEFSESEGLNAAQRQECFAIMLHCSTVPTEQILEVVTLKALTREQAQRAIESYLKAK